MRRLVGCVGGHVNGDCGVIIMIIGVRIAMFKMYIRRGVGMWMNLCLCAEVDNDDGNRVRMRTIL